MGRVAKIAAAQLGPVHLSSKREETVQRMITLLESAASQGVQILLFPEIAFVTFFPRHLISDQEELDAFFEQGDDLPSSPATKLLFDKAKDLGVDISVGFAERAADGRGYNASIYYSAREGRTICKYRKVHLPGTTEPFTTPDAVNQLEKRYFSPGDLGFPAFRAPNLIPSAAKKAHHGHGHADTRGSGSGSGDPVLGMMICNDRRWPEAWRCYGLQGVELVLCGFNTVGWAPDLWGTRRPMTRAEAEREALFHHRLVMQAGSYQNSCFSVSAAKAGLEDGKHDLIAGSCITDPEGHVVAEARGKGDELVVAQVDLEDCRQGKEKVFNFGLHRRVEQYGLITERTGAMEPELL